MYHDQRHFTDPSSFHPELFLGDPRFANDNFEVLQPFNVGPRNCLGRKYVTACLDLVSSFVVLTGFLTSLAYAEMRVILARMVFNFDLRIAEESKGWMERQKIFLFWQKLPLNVHLTPVTA